MRCVASSSRQGDDEFDDFKLDIVALAAIAGGRGDQRPCCQEEPNDEPWGPRDATHAKGFFCGSPRALESLMTVL